MKRLRNFLSAIKSIYELFQHAKKVDKLVSGGPLKANLIPHFRVVQGKLLLMDRQGFGYDYKDYIKACPNSNGYWPTEKVKEPFKIKHMVLDSNAVKLESYCGRNENETIVLSWSDVECGDCFAKHRIKKIND